MAEPAGNQPQTERPPLSLPSASGEQHKQPRCGHTSQQPDGTLRLTSLAGDLTGRHHSSPRLRSRASRNGHGRLPCHSLRRRRARVCSGRRRGGRTPQSDALPGCRKLLGRSSTQCGPGFSGLDPQDRRDPRQSGQTSDKLKELDDREASRARSIQPFPRP